MKTPEMYTLLLNCTHTQTQMATLTKSWYINLNEKAGRKSGSSLKVVTSTVLITERQARQTSFKTTLSTGY